MEGLLENTQKSFGLLFGCWTPTAAPPPVCGTPKLSRLTIDSVPTLLKSLLHSQGDQRCRPQHAQLASEHPRQRQRIAVWLRRHLRRRLVAQRIDWNRQSPALRTPTAANQALAALRSHQALKADRNEHTNAGPIVQIRSNPQAGTAATFVE